MNRTETSKSIYIPEAKIAEKNNAVDLLMDVSCNLSRFICMLFPQVIMLCTKVKAKKHHWKMYKWTLSIELKEEYCNVHDN